MRFLIAMIHATIFSVRVLADAHAAHFTIDRRGGQLATRELANLSHLFDLLEQTERRYGLTRREVKGNKLVRRAKPKETGRDDDIPLMNGLGQPGQW